MYEEYLIYVNQRVTEDIKKFVDDEVFRTSEYIFVKKEKGINKAFCTKCHKEFEIEDVKHNEEGLCPSCGASVTVKLTRYGRKNCTNEACFYYFEKSVIDPQVVICKGYYVTRDYHDYKNPNTKYELNAVYIFKAKKSVMLNANYGWGWPWNEHSTIFDFNTGWLAPKMCYCSFESIGEAIKDTSFQHIPYKEFQGHFSMVKLFDEYSKHPCIEYLVKEGLINLVEDKLRGYATLRSINWNGKTIFKVLKMNKADLRELRSKNVHIDFEFLKIFQDSKKMKWNLTIEEMKNILEKYSCYYDALRNDAKYSPLKRVLKYLSKQYTKFNGTKANRHYYSEFQPITIYKDYLGDCKLLGLDMKNEHVLFPKDLYKEHQHTTKQIKIKENKKYDDMIKKRVKSLEKYTFQDENYLIRPAKSSKEIIEEGSELNHCVATHYLIPYAKGETNILLLRKTLEPDKPFCTVEVKDNEVKQAYIKNDIIPPKDTLAFIEKFKKAKLMGKNKKVNYQLK